MGKRERVFSTAAYFWFTCVINSDFNPIYKEGKTFSYVIDHITLVEKFVYITTTQQRY